MEMQKALLCLFACLAVAMAQMGGPEEAPSEGLGGTREVNIIMQQNLEGELGDSQPNPRPVEFPPEWSCECDPWNGCGVRDIARAANDGDYERCPPEKRNPSGCGDFDNDPRAFREAGGECFDDGKELIELIECGGRHEIGFGYCTTGSECLWDGKNIANKQFETVHQEPNVYTADIPIQLKHYCIDWEIPLPNYSTASNQRGSPPTPPTGWLHRERWPKWGKYEYIPPQRYLHAAEHGALVFLYNPCLAQKWIDKIQDYAASVPPDNGGGFRFIISPYKDLRRKIAVITWSRVTYMDCYNEELFDDIYNKWYRRGWEDWPALGGYDYLWESWGYSPKTLRRGCVNPQCPERVFEPKCGSDGKTYPNPCFFENAMCVRSGLKLAYDGYCGDIGGHIQDMAAKLKRMERLMEAAEGGEKKGMSEFHISMNNVVGGNDRRNY